MIREWRHLKMLKRAGRAHDLAGVAGTQSGVSKRKTSLNLPQSSTGRENEKRGECVQGRSVGSGGGTVLG
jgi:hypothetical protein